MIKKIALFALLSLASISTTTVAERPWASTSELILLYNINPEWQIFSNSRLRFGDDFDTFNMWFADIGAHYRFHKNFNIGAAYRYLEYRVSGDWEGENRPMIQGHWFGSVADIKLRNRCRFEFRDYDFDRDDDVRFRNQTRAEFPWGIYGVKPYLEEEFFYSFNADNINQSWLTGGVYFKPADKTKVRVAYRWVATRASSNHEWKSANELYVALIQSF
ncbi:DUF2490 domain-containing protein [Pontiella agarivorans]|uniref:DUF2490 domain-containing protein n=1 Tax=Pontiella agarivorans TaxID=3038953 RepID=A0ABU5MWP3_9BACT|nr:DUF2490 domain-containing protein [Pontiella agarivorans]MDZ8118645.1 DUF2490 domain-containing protein [Pontiella agarivorans]